MRKLFLLIAFFILIIFPSSTLSNLSALDYLILGKKELDSGNFINAKNSFTKALLELKDLGDYILLWRAKANTEMGKYTDALIDLNEIKKNYSFSPVMKDARKHEINILRQIDSPNINLAYQYYINDYPDDLEMKFYYAQYLKEKNLKDKAKKLFKEIFLTASSFADKAEIELSNEDVTVDDLIKKAKALNNAYMFKKSEKYLREVLRKSNNKSNNKINDEILSTLGYSLFMQKKYEESASIYKNINDPYWRGRSLLRARDFNTFEKEMQSYIKSGDQRIGELLINYANIKRRAGNVYESLEVLKTVINKYPSSKEEALWYLGWNQYLIGNYGEAKDIFKELYSKYGNLKYLYWLERINEIQGLITTKEHAVSFRPSDFYTYLLYMKGKVSYVPETTKTIIDDKNIPIRLKLLIKADLKKEALQETKFLLKNNRDMEKIPFYCMIMNSLGDYVTSVRLISKLPDKFNYQDLLYPRVFTETVSRISKNLDIDQALIFAIMREESRFDREAVSPAGAIGLMQLMPATAKREAKKLGMTIREEKDIFATEKNITIGSYYLKKLINEFDNIVLAIAAYNAGENAVYSWINENKYRQIDEFIEDIPYNETRTYVKRVLTSYFEYLRIIKNLDPEKISEIIKNKGGKK